MTSHNHMFSHPLVYHYCL